MRNATEGVPYRARRYFFGGRRMARRRWWRGDAGSVATRRLSAPSPVVIVANARGRAIRGRGIKVFHLVALQQPVDPLFDPRQLAAFFGRDERVGDAFAAHAAGAADAMDVVVAELRECRS